jgi:hypothetical protein
MQVRVAEHHEKNYTRITRTRNGNHTLLDHYLVTQDCVNGEVPTYRWGGTKNAS